MSTFVAVGNATQAFPRLLDSVARIASLLPQPVFVQYGAYAGFCCPGCDAARFVNMSEFERRVREASLLIMHAGAGSVIHAVRSGKVPVVMPRQAALGEHVDDHQNELARELHRLGRVVACEEPSRLLSAVHDALRLQEALTGQAPEARLPGVLRRLLLDHACSLQHDS